MHATPVPFSFKPRKPNSNHPLYTLAPSHSPRPHLPSRWIFARCSLRTRPSLLRLSRHRPSMIPTSSSTRLPSPTTTAHDEKRSHSRRRHLSRSRRTIATSRLRMACPSSTMVPGALQALPAHPMPTPVHISPTSRQTLRTKLIVTWSDPQRCLRQTASKLSVSRAHPSSSHNPQTPPIPFSIHRTDLPPSTP